MAKNDMVVDENGIARPQDHKRKGEKDLRRVKLRGITWVIDVDAMDDADLMEDLVESENGNPKAMYTVIDAIVTNGGVKAVKDALRDENGKVKFSAYSKFFMELMESLNPSS